MPRFAVHQIEPYRWTVEDTDYETVVGTFGLKESADAFAALMNGGDMPWHRAVVIGRLDKQRPRTAKA